MALQKIELKRKFVLIKDNKQIELEDINPNLSPEEVCEIYSGTYPELVNSSITNKGIKNDCQVFHFSTIAGTKG